MAISENKTVVVTSGNKLEKSISCIPKLKTTASYRVGDKLVVDNRNFMHSRP